MNVKQVVHTVEHVRLCSKSSRTEESIKRASRETRGGEEAQGHIYESAEKENPTQNEMR